MLRSFHHWGDPVVDFLIRKKSIGRKRPMLSKIWTPNCVPKPQNRPKAKRLRVLPKVLPALFYAQRNDTRREFCQQQIIGSVFLTSRSWGGDDALLVTDTGTRDWRSANTASLLAISCLLLVRSLRAIQVQPKQTANGDNWFAPR